MADSNAAPVATRSKAVTALAVVTTVLGGLRLVLSVLAIRLLADALLVGPGTNPDLLKLLGFMMLVIWWPFLLVIAIVSIAAGILLVHAGLGLLHRSRFSRPLTLVLGALGGMLAVLYDVQFVSELADSMPTPEGVAVSLLGLLVHGGYCALVFVVLLDRRNAAEFT
jgi:hypothetical protein